MLTCCPDLKPDNILLEWKQSQLPDSSRAPPEVGKIILSDLDSFLEMEGWSGRPTPEFQDVRFGNIRWRAPEMQTGLGIGLFLKHTNNEQWEKVLERLQHLVTESAGDSPLECFENWSIEDFPRLNLLLKELLSKMPRFDPAERINMSQVMNDLVWTRH